MKKENKDWDRSRLKFHLVFIDKIYIREQFFNTESQN